MATAAALGAMRERSEEGGPGGGGSPGGRDGPASTSAAALILERKELWPSFKEGDSFNFPPSPVSPSGKLAPVRPPLGRVRAEGGASSSGGGHNANQGGGHNANQGGGHNANQGGGHDGNQGGGGYDPTATAVSENGEGAGAPSSRIRALE
eukprot:1189654-Prorocentrum_minimum.AAC.1